MRWRCCTLLLLTAIAVGAFAQLAHADGDPGSDVLVYQPLFLTADAGVSVPEQVMLGGLLAAASRSRFPIRVAIIASRSDLGAVTGLWPKPRAYARFLGLELSLAYTGRLLVVMPDGFGFNWPGHSTAAEYRLLSRIPIAPGGAGLLDAAQVAVRKLAAAKGVKLASAMRGSGRSPAPGRAASASRPTPAPGSATDTLGTIIALALAAIAAIAVAVRRMPERLGAPRRWYRAGWRRLIVLLRERRLALPSVAMLLAVVVTAAVVVLTELRGSSGSEREALAFNPALDPGTPVFGAAPGFTLSDQFGRPVSLHSFGSKVVILAFNDSECTTVCPLTTTAMLDAKAMLGRAGSQVQLLGIDANPTATSLEDVWSYSELHGMLPAWHFLTGSLPQLRRVWRAYGVEAAIEHGQITHTPALFVIDPQGREAKVYITQQSYAAVGQLGKLLAQEASSLLPNRPAVHSDLSYAPIAATTPRSSVTLPRAGGGTVRLGPGRSPRLYVFLATWDQETTSLAGQLDALNGYQAAAARSGLPGLTAVDEGSVEPSPAAVISFLHELRRPLSYPVAIDTTGRVADGYEVQGQPWFVLTSPSGQILWYWQVATSGWLAYGVLAQHLRAALARAPGPTSSTMIAQKFAGSPAPLAALHRQANRLLGEQPALRSRIRALRGYPIVLNAWASWCTPCRTEFGMFASASPRYGRQVAFLGADTDDSSGDARAFLSQHPVGYPSYQTTTTDLGSLASIEGLPSTIFINRAGKLAYVHTGQYDSQGSLDWDIESYALGG